MTVQEKRNGRSKAEKLLRRKLLLGLAASYRIIGERIGTSSTAVRAVLTETELGVPINRERMLLDIGRVISEIEHENAEAA